MLSVERSSSVLIAGLFRSCQLLSVLFEFNGLSIADKHPCNGSADVEVTDFPPILWDMSVILPFQNTPKLWLN